jgi:hypothetical protein
MSLELAGLLFVAGVFTAAGLGSWLVMSVTGRRAK